MLNVLCLCSNNGTAKPVWQLIYLQHSLLNILSLLLRSNAQKERFLSKYYCSLTIHLITQELWWRCTMRYMLFSCLLTAFFLQSMDQEIISTFQSYYRKTFLKVIATLHSDSFDGSEQSQLKTFWKVFCILDAIKSICDSWEEVKISTLIGIWKKLIPTLMDDFEKLKTSVKQVTAEVVEIARKRECGAWICDWMASVSW